MKTIRILFLIFAVIYVVINLIYLDKYPLVWADDVFLTEVSYNFLKTGSFGSILCTGYGLEKSHIIYGRIYLLAVAVFFYLFGVGPFQARIVSFLCGLIVLYLTYLISKRLFNEKIAMFSTVFLALTHVFILHSHLARPDIMVAMFILLTIYLFLLAKERNSLWLYFLCGIVASLTVDVHPPGGIAIVLLGSLLLFHIKSLNIKILLLTGAGVLLGLLWWTYMHVLTDPETFFWQWKDYWSRFEPPPAHGFSLIEIFRTEAKRYIEFFWKGRYHRNMLLFFLFFLSILSAAISAIKRKSYPDRFLLTALFAGILTLAFVVPHKTTFYFTYIFPLFSIISTKFLYNILGNPRVLLKITGGILLTSVVLLFSSENIYRMVKFRHANYYSFLSKIRQYIPADAVVAGKSAYWFGFVNQIYHLDYYANFLHYEQGQPKVSVNFSDFIKKNKIQYLIVDEEFFWWDRERILRIITGDKNTYVLIATIEDRFYGADFFAFIQKDKNITHIYRVNLTSANEKKKS